jgi:hypothetical protein
VNLFVALAPVAATCNLGPKVLSVAAEHIKEIELTVVDGLHIYNVIPPIPTGIEVAEVICQLPYVREICIEIGKVGPNGVDDAHAVEVVASNVPAGAGWKNWAYYGQMLHDKKGFRLYDYGHKQNEKIYGQEEPLTVPLQHYNVPTALLSGSMDVLGDPTDVAWLSEQIDSSVVFE